MNQSFFFSKSALGSLILEIKCASKTNFLSVEILKQFKISALFLEKFFFVRHLNTAFQQLSSIQIICTCRNFYASAISFLRNHMCSIYIKLRVGYITALLGTSNLICVSCWTETRIDVSARALLRFLRKASRKMERRVETSVQNLKSMEDFFNTFWILDLCYIFLNAKSVTIADDETKNLFPNKFEKYFVLYE